MLFGNVYLLIQLLLSGQIDRLIRKQTYLLLIRGLCRLQRRRENSSSSKRAERQSSRLALYQRARCDDVVDELAGA